MRRLLLLLLCATLFAAERRYARLGQFDGQVEVQLTAASDWMTAERNLPLPESAWVRTGSASRLEIELDEGSAWRLGPNSQSEIADYSRLSTGQRVTLLTLDRGLAYFSGGPEGKDALTLSVPGAQVILSQNAKLRLEVQESWSQIAVLEGTVRFSSRAAEIDLHAGHITRVEPANPARFFLNREVPAMELDKWSEVRDKALASSPSAGHVIQRYGLADFDGAGEWIQTEDLGAIWKPKVADTWAPFRNGRWRWYDALGYTWVSDDAWGWVPYHYGRWALRDQVGWVWAPSANGVFKPGDVYWLRSGARTVGWGPLAPGENWKGPGEPPQQYLIANTTFANYQPETMAVDPAGFTRPSDPLVASFALALPSPTFLAARLDAVRPLLIARTRVAPVVEDSAFPSAPGPSLVVVNPPPPPPVVVITEPAAQPVPEPVVQPVPYPVPVYIGTLGQSPTLPPQTSPTKATPPSTQSTHTTSPQPPPGRPARGTTPDRPPRAPERHWRTGESDVAGDAIKAVSTNSFSKAVSDLDQWTQRFPHSDFEAERTYYYVVAYNAVGPPAKVLEHARAVVSAEVRLQDPRQLILALYLTSMSAQKIAKPTRDQFVIGESAANMLLVCVRDYFTSANKPAETSDTEWQKARTDVETVARATLKRPHP